MCSSSCWWSATAPDGGRRVFKVSAVPDPTAERAVPRADLTRSGSGSLGLIALASVQPSPAGLPPRGEATRWAWLQQLRRCRDLDLEPWLQALDTGELALQSDLLAVLAERLDGPAQLRLLRCWCRQAAAPDPALDSAIPALLGRQRHPPTAAWLLAQLQPGPAALDRSLMPALAVALLPLLGHQRQPEAWPVLRAWLEAPVAGALRRAAMEGVAVGLPAWPRPLLQPCLQRLATDLDPSLAATAVDLLARLPGPRRPLLALARRSLDPAVAERLQRRLAATPAQPLLLLVHGRSGGHVPSELGALAAELEHRRGAPVRLQALTAPEPPQAGELLRPGVPLTFVPLLLLPGGHVRHDLPRLVAHWRRLGPVQRWPFLGAWPRWQEALGRELASLGAEPRPPLLLHHPLDGPLAGRYLRQLERRIGCRCVGTPYSAADPADTTLTSLLAGCRAAAPAALPLTLAANRLCERLQGELGALGEAVAAPLLQRPALRQLLLAELEALP